MVAERPMGGPSKQHKASPIYQDVSKIKKQIDMLSGRIQKDAKFSPTRDSLDEIANQIIHICNIYHETIISWDKHLKAAIIDLTEVPIMAPEMQRFAFGVALKDASKSLDLFLSGNW